MQGLSLLLGRTGRIPNRTVSPGRCSSAAGHSGETTPLKSVVLPALAHQPLSPRVQLKLTELRGRNSLRALYSIPVVRSLVIGAGLSSGCTATSLPVGDLLTELNSSGWDSRKRGPQGNGCRSAPIVRYRDLPQRSHPWLQDRGCATTQGHVERV